ncbi:MAG TPA: hypothetical protein VFG51_02115 [Candidatus Saccharimonadia bacterium]|nr:hypothetical protein [Candidatus Saccharimonadia bacterium]
MIESSERSPVLTSLEVLGNRVDSMLQVAESPDPLKDTFQLEFQVASMIGNLETLEHTRPEERALAGKIIEAAKLLEAAIVKSLASRDKSAKKLSEVDKYYLDQIKAHLAMVHRYQVIWF